MLQSDGEEFFQFWDRLHEGKDNQAVLCLDRCVAIFDVGIALTVYFSSSSKFFSALRMPMGLDPMANISISS